MYGDAEVKPDAELILCRASLHEGGELLREEGRRAGGVEYVNVAVPDAKLRFRLQTMLGENTPRDIDDGCDDQQLTLRFMRGEVRDVNVNERALHRDGRELANFRVVILNEYLELSEEFIPYSQNRWFDLAATIALVGRTRSEGGEPNETLSVPAYRLMESRPRGKLGIR